MFRRYFSHVLIFSERSSTTCSPQDCKILRLCSRHASMAFEDLFPTKPNKKQRKPISSPLETARLKQHQQGRIILTSDALDDLFSKPDQKHHQKKTETSPKNPDFKPNQTFQTKQHQQQGYKWKPPKGGPKVAFWTYQVK